MCIICLFMARYVAASNIFGEWRIHDLSKHGFPVSTCNVSMEFDFHVPGCFIWIIFIGCTGSHKQPVGPICPAFKDTEFSVHAKKLKNLTSVSQRSEKCKYQQ